MIKSDISSTMSRILDNPGPTRRPAPQEYRLLAASHEEELPGDLQSLSWLTAVDVPRLQRMASGHLDLGGPGGTHTHPGAVAGAAGPHVGASPGPLLHGPAGLAPPGVLGLGSLGHRASQVAQFPVGGPPTPGLQDPQPLFTPSAQPPFPIPQGAQQCPPLGLYGPPFGARPPYPQPRMAGHLTREVNPKHYPKPIYSYSCLIAMALKNSKTGSLPVSEIYSFMKEHFPYFKTAPDGWKNSVRHNLSLNKCFEKVENKSGGSSRKGCLWALNLARIDKMEEEMQKWKRKDLAAIHRSMANPDELDKLISDRPESCRRPCRPGEPEAPVLSCGPAVAVAPSCLAVAQLPPRPLVTLSLQAVPLLHQGQPLTRQAPDSPAPAQTPPLPHPQAPAARVSLDFPGLATDLSPEVDALDPSIVDFALQGNLWEEIKEEGFSLDALGTFGDTPLGCELPPVPPGVDQPFPDLQVTGLYTAYSAPDSEAPAPQHLGAPGNKPIALL
ncbi:forkhead box protein N4 [Erinaceus europaeus]|uniref:Forkhead box protein N4 n=1 Tax=Erinaceus europaeus TaxID=9365 RepID=A0ABM3XIF4_ERIEU|nr:forkhead box protein N4 [Erinaceus europaeus]